MFVNEFAAGAQAFYHKFRNYPQVWLKRISFEKSSKEQNRGKYYTSFLEDRQLLVANDGSADRTSDKHLHSPTRRNAAILVSLLA